MTDPNGGRATERKHLRAERYVLGLVFVVYLFSCKGYIEVSDTSFSIQTAEAIVTRGALDIPYSEGATLRGLDGCSYSKYGIGLPLYFLPWVAAGRVLSRATGLPAGDLTSFLLSFANIPFALLTVHTFARLLRLLGVTVRATLLMTLALAFGTLCWRYAGYDFSEAMQAGCLMLSVYCVVRRTDGAVILGGAGFAGLILVKLVHSALLPAFVGYLLARPGVPWPQRTRLAGEFYAPIIMAIGFVVYLNAVRFGSPQESGYGDEAGMFFPSQLWWTVPSLLGSLDKGLLVFCPIIILGLLGWYAFARRHQWEAALCGTLVVGNLVLSGAWHSWVGGWSWGPRLLVPAIPLWLLPAAFWIDSRGQRRKFVVAALLTATSVVAQLSGVLVKDQQIHHVKQNLLTPNESSVAYSDTVAAWSTLFHKLTKPGLGEVYRVSEFGVPGDRELDLTQHRTYKGINLWTEHTARQFSRPAIRWLLVVGLIVVGYLAVKLRRVLLDGTGG